MVNEAALRKLSSKIGGEWEVLGNYIGVPNKQIERLKEDYTQTEDRIFNMLLFWLRNHSGRNSIEQLEAALKKTSHSNLAENVHQILDTAQPQETGKIKNIINNTSITSPLFALLN